jgi:hypothetical protein
VGVVAVGAGAVVVAVVVGVVVVVGAVVVAAGACPVELCGTSGPDVPAGASGMTLVVERPPAAGRSGSRRSM